MSEFETRDRRYCYWCDEETLHVREPESDVNDRWACTNEADHDYPDCWGVTFGVSFF